MKKILAFSGSNNSKSINQQLVGFTATSISDLYVKVIDVGERDIPIYSFYKYPD